MTTKIRKPKRSYQRKSGVVRFSVPREPEICLGTGIIKEDVAQYDLRTAALPNTLWCFSVGDKVSIAKARITGAGPSYRVMHSIVWLGPDQLEASPELVQEALKHVDNNDMARKWARSVQTGIALSPAEKCVKLNEVEKPKIVNQKIGPTTTKPNKIRAKANSAFSESHSATISTSLNNPKPRNRHMDKKELRTLICQLTPSQVIHITFVGAKAYLTNDYTVLKIRTGKGRGGSKIVDLVDGSKNTISTGTKDNESILNITVGGVRHGHTDAAEVLTSYAKSKTQGGDLYRKFSQLLEAEGDFTVRVESPMPSLAGDWTVNGASRAHGRVKQIKLSLENVEDGRKTELWSYRHSGAVTKFDILDANNNPIKPEIEESSAEDDLDGESPSQFEDEDI